MEENSNAFIIKKVVLTEPMLKAPGLIIRPIFMMDEDTESDSFGSVYSGFTAWMTNRKGITPRIMLV